MMCAEDRITKAKVKMLFDHVFYGNLVLYLKVEQMPEEMANYLISQGLEPSMGTDGKKLYYNENFVNKLSDSELQWVITHEVLHCALNHIGRRQERNQMMWNVAIDFATNLVLKDEFGFVLKDALYNEKFRDMSAEEIYGKLPRPNQKKKDNQLIVIEISGGGKGGLGGQKDSEKEGNEQQSENGSEKENEEGEEGSGNSKTFKKQVIKIDGKKIKSYDNHLNISEEESKNLERDWKMNVVKAWTHAKMIGKTPAGMRRYLDELVEPKINWKEALKQFIVEKAKNDYSWCPPNRRFIHAGLLFPALTGESVGDLVVIVDNSGSIDSEELKTFFSEVNGILQHYEMTLHLLVIDAKVQSYEVYNMGDEINLKHKGGGGTDLGTGFQFIKDKNINPTAFIVLTDGYTPYNFQEPNCPTLWVLSENAIHEENIPFGIKTRIKN